MTTLKNSKNIIISALIIILFLGGLIWLSRNGSQNNGQANINSSTKGSISAEETSFDFGTVSMTAGKVSHIFKVKNNSSEPAMISKVYTSCMCTEAILMHGDKKMGPFGMQGHGFLPRVNDTVQPGDEVDVEAIFDPAAHGPAGIGRIDRVVFVETESGLPLQLRFAAIVTP